VRITASVSSDQKNHLHGRDRRAGSAVSPVMTSGISSTDKGTTTT
jgi:hypothetical protein